MKIILAKPRGFCAGVERAIEIVQKALDCFGAPIYVYHEIVHNRHVVEELKEKGAIFLDDLEKLPEGAYLIYSAHGVSPDERKMAKQKKAIEIDATCPLVTRNHSTVKRLAKASYHIVLIGHKKHIEVIATAKEAPSSVTVIETEEEIQNLSFPPSEKLFYLTQTTLSVDEVNIMVALLRKKFPQIETVAQTSICYATTNRQMALKKILPRIDLALIVGDPKSSNSNRLQEIAAKSGVQSYLINDARDLQEQWFASIESIGLTAGASTPERVVQECIQKAFQFGVTEVEEVSFQEEKVSFALPPILCAPSVCSKRS